MEHIALLFKPMGTALLYQEFRRPSGYTGRIIHMHDAHEICFIETFRTHLGITPAKFRKRGT